MTGIFRQKTPANLLLLLIMGILIKLPMFIRPYMPGIGSSDGFLYKALLDTLFAWQKHMPLLFPLLAFSLLYIQAVMLTRFINAQRMMNKPNYLPGMAYLLITSFLPEWNYFSAPLLVSTILLLILFILFSTYNQPVAKGKIFNIGLLLGLACAFFVPSLLFAVWVFLALAVMRPFRINEWLICLLGITTPYYFYAVYIIIQGNGDWSALLPDIAVGLPAVKQSVWLAIAVLLVMVPFLSGGYYVQENLRRMLIHVRKGWSLLLLYLLTAFLLPFVHTGYTFETWVLVLVPMAAFHACTYLYSRPAIYSLVLFWASVIFILVWQYEGPGW